MVDQEHNRALILKKYRASMSLGVVAKGLNLSGRAVQYGIRNVFIYIYIIHINIVVYMYARNATV